MHDGYANKDWPYTQNSDYSGNCFRVNAKPRAPDANEEKIPFRETKMGGNNGLRAPPSLTDRRNVSSGETGDSSFKYVTEAKMLGAEPSVIKA